MQTITTDKAKELINQSNGRIFSAVFIKADKTHRLINARIQTKYKSKTGRKQPYKPSDYNLKPVFDMKNKAFRMLNFNTILTLSINNNKYIIQ